MPIRIQSSNRVEKLQQNLVHELATRALPNPLQSEVIVVPTYAMSRWLNLRFAQHQGIAANIEYPLPACWLWQLASQVIDGIPERDPLALETMAWKIFSVLADLIDETDLSHIKRYLDDDNSGIKRWQLSVRLAEVFDRYQQYRPDMIRDWTAGKARDWQAVIWQSLIRDLDGMHRVEILGRLIDRLHQPEVGINTTHRVSLFAISSLPPMTIEVLLALSRHVDIAFYQHSPSDQYFADLKPGRTLSRLSLSHPHEIGYFDTGNELLASWGKQAQAMQTLLLDQDTLPKQEVEDNYPPGNTTLLQSIQQNIFDLNTTPVNTLADDSIAIHVCHSAMRECQVLHDQLLNTLTENPALDAEDILVMVPEISRYAPYIEAVFGYEDNASKPYLRWNLSDISIADEHPLVQSFLQLLRLPSSRFEVSQIMSLLEIPQISRRFGLDEAAINDIQQWVELARVRWGIDENFKLEMALPATPQNTWLQARQRLFTGYAMGGVESWNDIAALNHIDNNAALNIGKFLALFQQLDYWRKQLQRSASAKDWVGLLNQLMADFYTELDLGEDYLQEIRDCIDALNLADNCNMSAALLYHWMETQLGTQRRQGRLFSGGITFCGMRPMRNLPFQVICLLGMNDNAFPRRLPSYDFDYLHQQQRPGDPNSGDEDRYLMLETLLCARHSFYLSYTGRSLKDNSECQPSVLINELIDFIDNQTDPDNEQFKLSAQLIQLHPMQAFSAENFTEPLFSHDSGWRDVARQIQQPGQPSKELCWPQKTRHTEIDSGSDIDLKSLRRFLAHPLKYYVNTHLKIFFERDDEYDNDESFSLDSLSIWQIKSRLANNLLMGRSDSGISLTAEGLLPHGPAGPIELDSILKQHQGWLQQLESFSGIRSKTIMLDNKLSDEIHLFGEIENYYPGKGLMHHSASRLNGQILLKLWIDHLCLCATEQLYDSDNCCLIASDQTIAFSRLDSEQASAQLIDYCNLFNKAQIELLPVFPRSSYAFALETDSDKALGKALNAWQSSPFSSLKGDEDDDYIQLAIRNSTQNPLYHAAFAEYSYALYQAALKHRVTL